jgi:hypothetical protein
MPSLQKKYSRAAYHTQRQKQRRVGSQIDSTGGERVVMECRVLKGRRLLDGGDNPRTTAISNCSRRGATARDLSPLPGLGEGFQGTSVSGGWHPRQTSVAPSRARKDRGHRLLFCRAFGNLRRY